LKRIGKGRKGREEDRYRAGISEKIASTTENEKVDGKKRNILERS